MELFKFFGTIKYPSTTCDFTNKKYIDGNVEVFWKTYEKELFSFSGQIQNEINSINIGLTRNEDNWNSRFEKLSNKLIDKIEIKLTLIKNIETLITRFESIKNEEISYITSEYKRTKSQFKIFPISTKTNMVNE